MEKMRYSLTNLLKCTNKLSQKVYLLFYDLENNQFDEIQKRLRTSVDINASEVIKKSKFEYLALFCFLVYDKLPVLVNELDSIDIGEFEISEYQDKREAINSMMSKSTHHAKSCKTIYVNKDEKIIQTYFGY